MSMFMEPGKDWIPYAGEPLTCAKCGSRATERVKRRTNSSRNSPKRDVLVCGECGHITDRWKRTEGVV
jgi:hypothetical protein